MQPSKLVWKRGAICQLKFAKGVPFCKKLVYKRVRVGHWGGASPYTILLSTFPSPPQALVMC